MQKHIIQSYLFVLYVKTYKNEYYRRFCKVKLKVTWFKSRIFSWTCWSCVNRCSECRI